MSIESLKTAVEKNYTLDNFSEYQTVKFLLEFFELNTSHLSSELKKKLYKDWKEKQKIYWNSDISDEQA